MEYTEELKQRIWGKGTIVEGYAPESVRKDACGAWIVYDCFNDRDNPFGWEIDHIYPECKLKEKGISQDLIDREENLRPLNWRNNVSKGSDYPSYTATVKADNDRNKLVERALFVNAIIQERLKTLFNL